MLVGTLAISGVPFFSGFYSKDAILAAAMARVSTSPEHFLLFLLPAVGAVLTAFYMFRMWFLVFTGEPRGFPTSADEAYATRTDEEHALAADDDDDNAIQAMTRPLDGHAHAHGHDHDLNPAAHAHESEPIMTCPLIILAFMSIFVGWGVVFYVIPNPLTFLRWGRRLLEQMLEYGEPYRALDPDNAARVHWYALAGSALILLTGLGVGLLYYGPRGIPVLRADAAQRGPDRRAVRGDLQVPGPQVVLRRAVRGRLRPALPGLRPALPRVRHPIVVDRVVNCAADLTKLMDRLVGFLDVMLVDRLVNLTGRPSTPPATGPLDPDRQAAQLPDVPDRRPGRPVRRGVRLDYWLRTTAWRRTAAGLRSRGDLPPPAAGKSQLLDW